MGDTAGKDTTEHAFRIVGSVMRNPRGQIAVEREEKRVRMRRPNKSDKGAKKTSGK